MWLQGMRGEVAESRQVTAVVIGLSGRKRSGKDTVASMLREQYTNCVTDSFAAPIRSFVASLLGENPAWMEANKEQSIDWLDGRTPRQMMQTLGTEWGREMVHPELWVRALTRRVGAAAGRVAVISDVRFPNEADAIHELGGIVVEVRRRTTALNMDEHASEKPLDAELIDATIFNNHTLDTLRLAVALMCVDIDNGHLRHGRRKPEYH